MKKVLFILCLCCSVSITYGQVKVSLSYQVESPKAETGETSNGTIQADAIWQFSKYMSAFSGVGYNSRTSAFGTYNPYTDPLFCGIICCFGDCYWPDNSANETRLSNLEIPLGIRFNTPTFSNFEIGLSVGMVTSINVGQTVISTEQDPRLTTTFTERGAVEETITTETTTNDWKYFGNRLDVGLDVQYLLSKAWQLRLTGTWSALEWRGNDSNAMVTDHLYRPYDIKNNQTGLRLSVIRGF